MQIVIDTKDQRSLRAIEIAAGASQWLKIRRRDGAKFFGVPSQTTPNVYYLVSMISCTCPDAKRSPGLACKHQLAVRLYVALGQTSYARRGRVA